MKLANRYIFVDYKGNDMPRFIHDINWFRIIFGQLTVTNRRYFRNMSFEDYIADQIKRGHIRPLGRYEYRRPRKAPECVRAGGIS